MIPITKPTQPPKVDPIRLELVKVLLPLVAKNMANNLINTKYLADIAIDTADHIIARLKNPQPQP